MSANAGEVSLSLTLDESAFTAGLAAAQASIGDLSRSLAGLTFAPESPDPATLVPTEALPAAFRAAAASAGAAFSAALAPALSAASAPVAASAASLAEAATAALRSADAAGAGAQLSRTYAAGIAATVGAAQSAASGLASAALNAARASLSAAASVGAAFASGLAAGIRSGRSGVISAAVSVAEAAAEAARSALDIHSPSRVTRALGEAFDRGFIEGVDRNASAVEDSIRSALRFIPSAAGTPVAIRSALPAAAPAAVSAAPVVHVRSAPIDYDALAEAMDRRRIVLTMDNRRVAEIQQRETARAQSLRTRRIALGCGQR